MGHSYEESKSLALKTILILGGITIAEVLFALLGKGYLVKGVHFPLWLIAIVMIVMSIVKAYLVVFEFMHMKYEVPALAKTVLLPTLLLVWGIIAFFQEGSAWRNNRDVVKERNEKVVDDSLKPQGMLLELPELKENY